MQSIKVSVVIPCLNEEKAIGICINKIKKVFAEKNISGEIVVVDNGSTDKSADIANGLGARVIEEKEKGYGSALRRGIDEAYGEFIIMADGDDTYDFLEIGPFIEKLDEGYDLVMGSRFKGKILKGAMTWSHRYIGNPILSGMLRLFFGGTVSDSHCGLRAFTKLAYIKMNLKTTGMEFASEMVIHSMKEKLKIAEIPIIYHPREGESKLSSIRDAWRHTRFMLLYSPNYLFFAPGILLFLVGIFVTFRIGFEPLYFLGRIWDIHVMIFSSMMAILGWQIITMWFIAKLYIQKIGLEHFSRLSKFYKKIELEKILFFGILISLLGLFFAGKIIYVWYVSGFGELSQTKNGIISIMLITIGMQTVFAAFLMNLVQLKYKGEEN